MIDINLLGN